MGRKGKSKAVWVESVIMDALEEQRTEEGYTGSLTSYTEMILKQYAEGKYVSIDKIAGKELEIYKRNDLLFDSVNKKMDFIVAELKNALDKMQKKK